MIRRRSVQAVLALALALSAHDASAGDDEPESFQATFTNASLEKIRSSKQGAIRAGLEDARVAGKSAARAAPDIAKRLDAGLPPNLAELALDTLAELEAPASAKSIVPYARHRRVRVRRAAVRALVHTRGPEARGALLRALSDSDAEVRGLAATGLGTIGAKDSVPVLYKALDHRIGEAASAIGQLCTPKQCEGLLARLGRIAFDIVSGGLDQVLFRPAGEIDDETKIKIVGHVRELGTGEANKFLADAASRWPSGWSKKVKFALDQAVKATEGAGGTR